jgi:cbb3-type cytochrome oxidase maturation protein
MQIIFLLLAISVAVAIVFFIVFVLSVKRGQYEDTYTPSVRMLFEDDVVQTSTKSTKKSNS